MTDQGLLVGVARNAQVGIAEARPEARGPGPGDAGRLRVVALPYVFKYLLNELAAMNIRLRFKLRQ